MRDDWVEAGRRVERSACGAGAVLLRDGERPLEWHYLSLPRRHGTAAGTARFRRASQFPRGPSARTVKLLTEEEVQRSFRRLFAQNRQVDPGAFDKAESLLNELRPESPLRIRLQQELAELRKLHRN